MLVIVSRVLKLWFFGGSGVQGKGMWQVRVSRLGGFTGFSRSKAEQPGG